MSPQPLPAETEPRTSPAGRLQPSPVVEPMLDVAELTVVLGSGLRALSILKGVDVSVPRGTTVGLVGESGSGKSTLAKTLVGEHPVSSGTVRIAGTDISEMDHRLRQQMRRRVQLIPQDPYSSLSPRRTIGATIAEAIDPIRADARRHAARIRYWLEKVSLPADAADRYPHEFSGGQRQRIAIARALAVEPELIIADEITSALDLTTQAEILNLLAELREELSLTMLFISHNLAVVRHVSDAVVVLYHGEVVESGSVQKVYTSPEHPYTQQLIASVPGGPAFSIDD